MIALIDAGDERFGRGESKSNLGGSTLGSAGSLEAGLRKDPEHGAVVRHHLSEEFLDADQAGERGQSLEHAHRDPSPLQLVGNRKSHFCDSGISKACVARQRRDPFAVHSDKRTAFGPVWLEHGRD